jgi:hypothetical protein
VRFVPFIIVALILLGFVWSGWWLWAVLIFVLETSTWSRWTRSRRWIAAQAHGGGWGGAVLPGLHAGAADADHGRHVKAGDKG